MKLFQSGEVPRVDGLQRPFESCRAVVMRQQIAMVQHIDPDLPVAENFDREGVLEHLPGSSRRENKSAVFQIVLHRLPSQFEAVFKPLNGTLLFQRIQSRRPVLQRLTQEHKRAIEVLKTLLPADVGVWIHNSKFDSDSFAVPPHQRMRAITPGSLAPNRSDRDRFEIGAGGGTRTPTPLREPDFESSASAISPHRQVLRNPVPMPRRRIRGNQNQWRTVTARRGSRVHFRMETPPARPIDWRECLRAPAFTQSQLAGRMPALQRAGTAFSGQDFVRSVS